MFFLPEQLMGLSPTTRAGTLAAQYARIVGFSYIFNSLTGVYVGAHRSMENPKLGMIIFGVSMLTNAFLNWVFIFGNLGAPALGVVGAAVATLSARVLEFVIMLSYALTNRRFRLKPAVLFRPGRALLAKFSPLLRAGGAQRDPLGPGHLPLQGHHGPHGGLHRDPGRPRPGGQH